MRSTDQTRSHSVSTPSFPAASLTAQRLIADAMRRQHGPEFAKRWLQLHHTPVKAPVPRRAAQKHFVEHPSYTEAVQRLESYREALGAAYETVLAIARWSIEHATPEDPAPHLLTTYWTLEEITGRCERTLIRHLVEDDHPWSETVSHLIDVRQNYGEMLQGDSARPCIVGTIIRFFPHGRQTPNARVKRWAERDLIEEADQGRTKPTRPNQRERYERRQGRMSVHSSMKEQSEIHNWVMMKVGRTISHANNQKKNSASLYADIPRTHVLDALRADYRLEVEHALERGANVKRARAKWVELAGMVLAQRFNDHAPPTDYVDTTLGGTTPSPNKPIGYKQRQGRYYPVYAEGFTNLWRRALWTAIRVELYGNSHEGWRHVQRLVMHADEGDQAGKRNPTAWAWTIVKNEGFEELLRDYDTGAVA